MGNATCRQKNDITLDFIEFDVREIVPLSSIIEKYISKEKVEKLRNGNKEGS